MGLRCAGGALEPGPGRRRCSRRMNRPRWPISAARGNAVNVEIPRGHSSRRAIAVNSLSVAIVVLFASRRWRRPVANIRASCASRCTIEAIAI